LANNVFHEYIIKQFWFDTIVMKIDKYSELNFKVIKKEVWAV